MALVEFQDCDTFILLLESSGLKLDPALEGMPKAYLFKLYTPEFEEICNLQNIWLPLMKRLFDRFEKELTAATDYEQKTILTKNILNKTFKEPATPAPAHLILRDLYSKYPTRYSAYKWDQHVKTIRITPANVLAEKVMVTHPVVKLLSRKEAKLIPSAEYVAAQKRFADKSNGVIRGLANGIQNAPFFAPTPKKPVFADLINWVELQKAIKELEESE